MSRQPIMSRVSRFVGLPEADPASGSELQTAGQAHLAAIRAGDLEVFGRLFTEQGRAVYAFCGRRTGEWLRAEDLTSIVFLEAWRTRESAFVTPDGSLMPWLFGIARHVVSNSRRSLRRYNAALTRFSGQYGASIAGEEAVEEEALRRADQQRASRIVAKALGRLPRDLLAVAEVCLLTGLSTRQAAEVLHLPESVVVSRRAAAATRLRRLLRSREIEEPSWLIGHDEIERPPGASPAHQGGRRE